jgi:CheY-like chemotaxis protein
MLPAVEEGAEPITRAPAGAAWRGSGTALVVDDEETVRRVAARMLESCGFSVMTAADGRAGVDAFAHHAVDVVLLDLTMPAMDGEEALRNLRRLRPDVRVIMMSGYDEQDVTNRFPEARPSGFLQKPFTLGDLRAKLRAVFESGIASEDASGASSA